MMIATNRLRKHADYQRVYKASRKRFGKQMSYFFALREPLGPDESSAHDAGPDGPRVGLTVSKAMGNAVDRNRIKRRMREAVRRQLPLLRTRIDVVLHPQRNVIDLDFAILEREVASVFQVIQRSVGRQSASSLPVVD
jgi:ribonuclease P protein component